MSEVATIPCQISADRRDNWLEITVRGDWVRDAELPPIEPLIAQIDGGKGIESLKFSTTALGRWDSLLVTDLIKVVDCATRNGIQVDRTTLPESIQGLLTLAYAVPERVDAQRLQSRTSWFHSIVIGTNDAIEHTKEILVFVGDTVISSLATLRGQAHFRRVDLWLYVQECGPSALPIVTLISLLVGLILAFVGAVQLALFGAQIYIANLVSLGMTREMGGLMTAVIMSGRTGAAYAAQLGTMHVNNEIDALKTMNLDPMAFLVLPRMLALIFIMPLLCLYADLMGIIGGGVVTVSFFDVSLTEYLDRTADAVKMKDFVVGFVKSSVFGILIALSGCMRGMQCGRSASAVGDAGTSAVVTAIVFIVVADSVMTIICNRLGI